MKKIVLIIAAIAAFSGVTAVHAAEYTEDIVIVGSRNFWGEEITADNTRTITVVSSEPLRYDKTEFDAYIVINNDSYRLVRREAH